MPQPPAATALESNHGTARCNAQEIEIQSPSPPEPTEIVTSPRKDHSEACAVKKQLLERIIDDRLGTLRRKLLQDLCNVIGTNARNSETWGEASSYSNGGKFDKSIYADANLSYRSDDDSQSLQQNPRTPVLMRNKSFGFSESARTSDGNDPAPELRPSLEWKELTLWSVWDEVNARRWTESRSASRVRSLGKKSRFLSDDNVVRSGDTMMSKGCCQAFIVRPSSQWRVVWELFSLLCIGYDIFFIPMTVFDLSEVDVLNATTLAMAIFWTADMFFTFFVGFHTIGVIDMRPKKIAKRYFRTWFFLDLVVISCDWFLIIENSMDDSDVGILQMSKSFRISKLFRVLRFLRIWKVVHLLTEFNQYMCSENLMQLIGIINFIIVILVINHYIACGWYAIAEYYPEGEEKTWLYVFRSASKHSRTILFDYTTSLHWSFTQFTPASMEVHPCNSLERVYSIVVLLGGLVVFSSFVSGITSAMTRVRENNKERNRQDENIRRYITDNKVSLELGRRIHNYLKSSSFMHSARLLEDDISAFKALPLRLLIDLHAEVFLPILTKHPFFSQFLHVDEVGLVEICDLAVGEVAAVKGQHIFSFEQKAIKMLFCNDGLLRYFLGLDGALSPQRGTKPAHVEIIPGLFLSEQALWVQWLHQGRLEAASNCVLIEVRVEDFHNLVVQTYAFKSCQSYARAFAQRISVEAMFEHSESMELPRKRSIRGQMSLSDMFLDDCALRELARCAFEEQSEEMHSTVSKLQKMYTMVHEMPRHLGDMMIDFFRMRTVSSATTSFTATMASSRSSRVSRVSRVSRATTKRASVAFSTVAETLSNADADETMQ